MKFCSNCGAKNEDDSLFCSSCGMRMEKTSQFNGADTNYEGFGANSDAYSQNPGGYNGAYGQGYNQYSAPVQIPSKTKVIVGLVLGVLFGGGIGLVFAILALVLYSDYENAIARQDMDTALLKAKKVKTYNKIAWVFIIIGIVAVAIAVAGMIVLTVAGLVSFTGGTAEIPTGFFEYSFGELPINEFDASALGIFLR